MASDILHSLLSSKALRATVLILIFVFSYYFGNPFSNTSIGQPPLSTEKQSSWIGWGMKTGKAPQDITQTNITKHDSHEGGPKIRQATMIYSTDEHNNVYERAVASHIRHGDRWGQPTHVLRHDIVEAGFFNKPAYLLGLVIDEMAKPNDERADWIV